VPISGAERANARVLEYRWAGSPPSNPRARRGWVSATQGGGTVTTNTLVNGVGDHAAFLAESITAQGATIKVDSLIALDGKVVIACANYSVGSSPDATQLSDLTRCGQRTVSQL